MPLEIFTMPYRCRWMLWVFLFALVAPLPLCGGETIQLVCLSARRVSQVNVQPFFAESIMVDYSTAENPLLAVELATGESFRLRQVFWEEEPEPLRQVLAIFAPPQNQREKKVFEKLSQAQSLMLLEVETETDKLFRAKVERLARWFNAWIIYRESIYSPWGKRKVGEGPAYF